jgi:methyl-accepting chemotaxis protein
MIHRNMKDIAMAKTTVETFPIETKIDEIKQGIFQEFEIVRERFLGNPQMVEDAYTAVVDWKPIRDEVIALRGAGKVNEAAAITREKGADHVALIRRNVKALVDFAEKKADEFMTVAYNTQRVTKAMTWIVLAFLVVFCLIVAIVVTRSITKPLGTRSAVTERVAEGDLNQVVTIKSKDELRRLAAAFNTMIANVRRGNEVLMAEKNSVEAKIEVAMLSVKTREEYLSNSVNRMLQETNKFAQGDLTVHLVPEREDQIGRLYQGFNQAVDKIKHLLNGVKRTVSATVSAASQIDDPTELLTMSSQV